MSLKILNVPAELVHVVAENTYINLILPLWYTTAGLEAKGRR